MSSLSQSATSFFTGSATTLTTAPAESASSALSVATLVTTATVGHSAPLATYLPSQDGFDLGLGHTFLQSANAGVYIGAVFLGLHTFAFARAVSSIWRGAKPDGRYGWLLTISLLWLMALINEASNITSNSNAWLNYDGKGETSFNYFAQGQGSSLNGAIAISAFFVSLLTDGFLFVRCLPPSNKLWTRTPLAVIAVPSLVWNIMAVVFALEHHSNGTRDGWILPLSDTQGPATLGLPVAIGLPSVLHVIYTVLLAWRSMRAPQPTRRESPGAGTVIVESALPYGCLSLALLILWATKSIAVNDFIPMLIQIQGITVDLIIARTCTVAGQAPVLPQSSRSVPSAARSAPKPASAVSITLPAMASMTTAIAPSNDEKASLASLVYAPSQYKFQEAAPPRYDT